MTTWHEDPQVWDALDDFVNMGWTQFKELLDVLFEHHDEFDAGTQALLFGGLGRFMQVYHVRRSEANTAPQAFSEAIHGAFTDRRVQALMESAANGSIDEFVLKMKGGE